MRLLRAFLALVLLLAALNLLGGFLLPDHLLKAPVPVRTEAQREQLRAALAGPGDRWTFHEIVGGEGAQVQLTWLHRPTSRGVVLYLHGFGDDAFGTAGYSRSLTEWDAVLFTFRGRDLHPEIPSTLGAWERVDVAAVVVFLESKGIPRSKMLMVGASQGAGVALLALADLERSGAPLAGALLESPFRDLRDAAKHHVGNQIGRWEWLFRGAVALALERAEKAGRFNLEEVSPLRSSRALRTPVALLTGDADRITPLAGVRDIAQHHPDLVVVNGAGHCEAGARVPEGWSVWAHSRLDRWGLLD